MPTVGRRFGIYLNSAGDSQNLLAPVILMVSGGADSTALLYLAATGELDIDDGRGPARIAKERLHVLHINHHLRGLESDEDQEFVEDLCRELHLPLKVVHVDVENLAKAKAHGTNVENVGREERYAAAERLANELSEKLGTARSAARILTAHTADDRAETFVMNAMRGSATAGLSSLARRRNRIVRPLLDKSHEELCDYLRMKQVVWREDSTNADTNYLRSFVRHEVLPQMRKKNPRVSNSLSQAAEILNDEDIFLNQLASRALRELTRRKGPDMIALDAMKLAATEVAIARRMVRKALLELVPDARLESKHIARILEIVAAGTGSCTVPLSCDVRVEYGLLFMRSLKVQSQSVAHWLELDGTLQLGALGSLRARFIKAPNTQDLALAGKSHASEWSQQSVWLDADALGLSRGNAQLWVDTPQPGDVLQPLGMHGQSKKLSDLLNEAKIPAHDRSKVLVVRTSPNGQIVWVAGIRPDERGRLTQQSCSLLELTYFSPAESHTER